MHDDDKKQSNFHSTKYTPYINFRTGCPRFLYDLVRPIIIRNRKEHTYKAMQCSKLGFYFVHLPGALTPKMVHPAICLCVTHYLNG